MAKEKSVERNETSVEIPEASVVINVMEVKIWWIMKEELEVKRRRRVRWCVVCDDDIFATWRSERKVTTGGRIGENDEIRWMRSKLRYPQIS